MAIITAYKEFNQNDLNFYDIFEKSWKDEFSDNIYFVQNYEIYNDLYAVYWEDSNDYFGIGFLGQSLHDINGTISGTVTGLTQAKYNPYFEVYSYVWDIDDISLSMSDVYSAAATKSTKDDIQLMRTQLSGDDTFFLSDDSDTAYGYAGNDIMFGLDGINKLYGGKGNDELYGGGDPDSLYGEKGNDVLYGGDEDDELYGGGGQDILYLDAGEDRLIGGGGQDWLYVFDSLDTTVITPDATVNLTIWGTQNTGYGYDVIRKIENISGGRGDDKFYGTNYANKLLGKDGDDVLKGQGGNDKLYGGNGSDRLYGGEGKDKLYGGQGNDSLYMDAGDDTVDGGGGKDTLYITNAIDTTIYLAQTTSQNTGHGYDKIVSIEDVSGGDGADRLVGTRGANTLSGNGGADILKGKDGNDTLDGGTDKDKLYGGNDNDYLSGGADNDTLFGEAGNDMLFGGSGIDYLHGGSGDDKLFMDIGNDRLIGGSGEDWICVDNGTDTTVDLAMWSGQNTGHGFDIIRSVEHASGNSGHDTFYGNSGVNILLGDSGDDHLYGRDGDDTLDGGNDDDYLSGGTGDDILKGGEGKDVLNGGLGQDNMYAGDDSDEDTFIFTDISDSVIGSGRDRIYEFESGEDLISLYWMDADTSTANDDRFSFSTNGSAANSVWVVGVGSNALVRADVNGDTDHDFEFLVVGVSDLNENDFIL